MTPTHQCSVPGCGRSLPLDMLMCRAHWFRVPKALRDEVWAAWRQYQRGTLGLDELREVQQRATDAVVEGGVS